MIYRPAAGALLLLLLVVSAVAQPPAAEPLGRRVYVPVEDLDVVLEHDKQGVVLPRAEFLKLAADAKKQQDETPTSTLPVVVSLAAYAGRIIDSQLVVSVTIELNQLSRGWQMVSLPFTGLSVEGATLDAKSAQLGRGEGGARPLVLFMNQLGKHVLKLELSGPLVNIGSDQSAGFGVPAISPASFQITLPAGKFLHVNETPLERPAAADQPAAYNVPVGGKTSLELRITDRRSQRESASLVFAGTAIGLYVAPEERTWRAITSLNVFGKPIDNLTFSIPKSLEIVSVESNGLERWEIGEGAGGDTTTLKLVYRQPFNESRTVTFNGVSASVLGQPWSVPNLSLASATSHVVRVLVQHPTGLRLHEVETTGVRRLAADDVAAPEAPGDPSLLVKVGAGQVLNYAAWKENFALLFVTQPRARELQATIATRIDVTSHELSLRSSIAVQCRFAPMFDFDMALPVDWTVTDILIENRPVPWRTIPVRAEQNQVRIAFGPPVPANGKVNLTLVARMIPVENLPIEDRTLSVKLPEVTLPQVGVTDGRYMIAAEDDLDLLTEEVTGLDPARLAAAEQQAANAPRLVYEYQDTRFSGTLKVTRKPVRVAAQTLAFHRLDRETFISHLEARMVVQGGGLQRLQVSLPEAVGTNLRFSLLQPPYEPQGQVPRITEQTSTPPANGKRVWTLQLDQRAFGLVWLVVDLTSPRRADVKTIVLPGIIVTSADRQNGYVAVEAGPDQQLDVTAVDAAGQPLVEVDPADVPAPQEYVPHERIVAAYRVIRPDYQISLAETRYDRQAVPTAFCDRARLTSVLGEGGQQQHKAEFSLRAVGVQSLQVALPDGATLWATSVAGRPVEVRKEAAPRQGWIVPFPAAMNPAEPVAVELFYRTSDTAVAGTGRLSQKPPRIMAIGGRGDEEPVEILTREWVVYHPSETEITASTGEFEPVQRPSRATFLGGLHHALSHLSPHDFGRRGPTVGVVAAVIFVVFYVYRRRGAKAAGLTVLAGFLLLIGYGFLLPYAGQEHASSEYYAESDKVYNAAPSAGEFALSGRFDRDTGIRAESTPMPTTAMPPGGGMGGTSGMPGGPPGGGPMPPMGPAGAASARPMAQDELNEASAAAKTAEDDASAARRGFASRQKDVNRVRQAEQPAGDRPPAEKKDFGIGTPQFGNAPGPPPPTSAERARFNKALAAEDKKKAVLSPEKASKGKEFFRGRNAIQQGGLQDFRQPVLAGSGTELDRLSVLDQDFDGRPDGDFGEERYGRVPLIKGALLSLAIDLPVPPNSRPTQFRYSGSPAADAVPTLEVEYQSRRAIGFVSIACQMGVLLLFWLARKRSTALRAALGILGILVPLSLVAVVSIDLLPYLDGLFLGSLWGLALWCLFAVVPRVKQFASSTRTPTTLPIAIIALACACGFASPLRAQDPNAAAAAPPKSLGNTIVIPYDPAQDPLQSARVFLPWEKFLELWNAAHPDQAIEAPAPTDGLVAEALYAVQLGPPAAGKTPLAEVSARFVVHSLSDDQVTIGLPVGPVAFSQAQLDGQSAALITREIPGGSELAVVVPTRGVHVLDAKFTLKFEQAGGAGKITLATKPVPAGLLRLTLPEGDQNLRVSGGARTFRKLKEANRTVALVPVDAGGEITVAWSPALVREAAQGIVHVESATALALGDAGLRIHSSFKYTVRQGVIADVSYSLPPGVLVRQIAGLDLGGWEIAGDGVERTLKVFLRRPVNDATTVQFDLFVPQSFTEQALALALPQFAPTGVTRETGTLGIFAEKQITVTAGSVAGLSQIDVGQFFAPPMLVPPGATAPAQAAPAQPLMAYRFAARPVQLQLQVARRKPQSKGTAEHAIVIGPRKQRMASRFELQLAGAPRSEITIDLPIGYLLYDLKASETVDYHVEPLAGAANEVLIIELTTPGTGSVEFVLEGIVPRVPEDTAPQIAVPAPLEIGELRTTMAVWLDRIYTGTLDELSGWKSVDPATLPERLRGVQHTAAQFAFTSNLIALQPVGLTLNRAVPRLSADSLSVVIARDTSIQHLLYLRWQITAAGESTFVFTTPDWLADRLEFDRTATALRIRQVVTEKIAGNRLRWIVTLDDPRTTVATLIAQATLPPPDAARIAAVVPVFEQMTVGENGPQYQTLDQQHQYIVLANQSPQRLEQTAPDAVTAIPAIDLPIKISQTISDQAAEILRVREPRGDIGWTALGAQQQRSSAASVNLAKMTLVIAHDGSWRGLAHYKISNRSRQFLALRMPDKSRILSLIVADIPSRPINPQRAGEPNLVLIPLPKTAAGDLSAEVRMVYAGQFDQPLPKGFQVSRTEVDLPAPQVLSQADDPNFGIPVAATEWTVILPPDLNASRIEDAARSNVTESEAGVEEQIAQYNEWLNLAAIVLDDSETMPEAKSRAMNNLKQIRLAQPGINVGPGAANTDSRQNAEYWRLENSVQEVQSKLQTRQSMEKGRGAQGVDAGYLSNSSVQRELMAGNTADFQVGEKSAEQVAEDDFSLSLSAPSDKKEQAAKNQVAEQRATQQAGANRNELRRQTASQSEALNFQANAGKGEMAGQQQGRSADQSGKKLADASQVDADQVLDSSKPQTLGQQRLFGGTLQGDGSVRFLTPEGTTADGNAGRMPGKSNATGFGFDMQGRGLGGMGGGGGRQLFDGSSNTMLAIGQGDVAIWKSAGGLSLAIDIPQDGQRLTFSKSGGDARLALGIRPAASLEFGLGLGWAAVWLCVAVGFIAALRRTDALAALGRWLPPLAIGVGLLWYFLLPVGIVGFGLFVVGAVVLAWQHRHGN
jgi:hypothetical protein